MGETRSETSEVRNSHVLKPTKSEYRPRRMIFFDTETDQTKISDTKTLHTLKLGHTQFWRYKPGRGFDQWREFSFWGKNEFLKWLDDQAKKKSTTYLIAHNITFDLTIMGAFKKLPEWGWEMEAFYSKGMVSIYRWSKDGQRIIGLDNTNFYAESLKSLGDRLGVPKLDIDFEKDSEEYLLEYCERDVKIMVEGIKTWFDFLDDNRCGAFKPTISSTAFNTWRHRFLDHKVHIHDDLLAIDLEREAYQGGRTECLWVGERTEGPYYYLDVNSMYGYILASREFPGGMWGSKDEGSLYELAYKLKRYCVIARVTLNVTDNWFPIKIDNHTAYPIGQFTATLTTPELKIAIQNGWIEEVHALAWYRKHKLFEKYISEFYNLRKNYKNHGNEPMEKIVKLIINGLYGKFGQRKLTQEKIGECDPDIFFREQVFDMEDQEYYDHIYLGGTIFRERHEGESYHSFPGIAAHVTAHARVYLTQFLKQVPPGHAFYMDTDSIIVDQKGYDCLKFYQDPNTLGMLKTELKSPWLRINAPKDYAMRGRHRMKGIKSSAEQIDDDTFEQSQWPRLNGIIRDNLSGRYITQKVVKRRSGKIWSGRVTPSGWIDPFVLSEGIPVSSVPLFQHLEQHERP